jgi:putative ABC transport system ATP-binding protein
VSPVVAACGIYRFYHSGDEETAALRGVDLVLHRGSFTALMGPSGSGKSTLLACLAGLDDPDGGRVSIGEQTISRRPEPIRARLRARTIGMMMQSGNLLEHLSVDQNMSLQQAIAGKDDIALRRDLLTRLGIDHRSATLPSLLSGGEAARAALAVALSAAPVLLICDEPTAEVDAASEAGIIALLQEQARRGTAILVATHSDVLAEAADRVVRLSDWRIAN